MWALAHSPCYLGDPQRKARGKNQKWLPQPNHLGGPNMGNDYITPTTSGVPNTQQWRKTTRGYHTHAILGPKCGQWLHNSCCLGGPKRLARGGNQRRLPHLCHLKGLNVGNGYITPVISGVPNAQHRGKSEKVSSPVLSWGAIYGQWLRKPCHLRGA